MTTTPAPTDLDALVETANAALVAAAERTEGATDDGSTCLKDEAECFRISPVHFAWYQLGETGVIGETKAIARVVIEAAHKPLLDELDKTRAELDKAQQMEAMAGRHAQQRDADLKDAEVTIQRLKTRLAEADARWSRHMTDEHPIQSDGDCPARAEKGYAEELDKALQLLSEYIDDESCHIDHNGYCQEHGLSSTRRGGCRNVRAKQLLAANPATTAEPAAPIGPGGQPCSVCETNGMTCLDEMNRTGTRCCYACGLADVHNVAAPEPAAS